MIESLKAHIFILISIPFRQCSCKKKIHGMEVNETSKLDNEADKYCIHLKSAA